MTTPDEFVASHHVGKGWVPLVEKLVDDILALEPENFRIHQVKEKFGGLRFYYGCSANHERTIHLFEKINDLVSEAEEASYHICEVCGHDGRLRDERSWILTLCDKHNKQEPKDWYSDNE